MLGGSDKTAAVKISLDQVETQPIDLMSHAPPEPPRDNFISPDHSAATKRATFQNKGVEKPAQPEPVESLSASEPTQEKGEKNVDKDVSVEAEGKIKETKKTEEKTNAKDFTASEDEAITKLLYVASQLPIGYSCGEIEV